MDRYEIIRPIGKGSFGKVYLVKHKGERKHYCMKTIKLEGVPANERKACEMEVKLLEAMLHPNIVGFKESFTGRSGKLLCIVMTYCDGGDLTARLQQANGKLLKESQILHWFVQLALGLHFMHDMTEKCVLHRDLKTQNIFLLGNGRLVIGDLGISKVLDHSTDFTKTTIGTPYYMSPEVYKSKPYNHKSDIWALGCVLYEMATLRHAFNAKSLNGLIGKVVKGRFEPLPNTFSQNLHRLVDRMLSLDPDTRPSLPEILSLPFIKRHVFLLLHGIAQRPASQIGDGTMVLRKAAMGVGGCFADGQDDEMSARQTENLKRQLERLGMEDIVQRAFMGVKPTSLERPFYAGAVAGGRGRPLGTPLDGPGPMSRPRRIDENNAHPSNKRHNEDISRRSDLRQAAKDQRSALVLEREKKRAVENALEKLRRERMMRAQERLERLNRQRQREERVRQRQEELRQQAEEKRQKWIRKQRRTDERLRVKEVDRYKEAALQRLKDHNPQLVAQRKARQFERQYHEHAPLRREASPPPPPPPPFPPPGAQQLEAAGLNQRDLVRARKDEQRREAERAHKGALMQAAQERMQELKRAQEFQHRQYHSNHHHHQQQRQHDARGNEQTHYENDGGKADLDGGGNIGGISSYPDEDDYTYAQAANSDSDSDDEDDEEEDEEIEHEMDAADSDDDDLDHQEEELKQELEAATLRCHTIKQTLDDFRSHLQQRTYGGKNEIAEEEDDEEEESDDDSSCGEDEDNNDNDDGNDDVLVDNSNVHIGEDKAEIGCLDQDSPLLRTRPLPALQVENMNADCRKRNDAPPRSCVAYCEFEASESEDESSDEDSLFSPLEDRGQQESYGGTVLGGLKFRVQRLEEECICALGKRRFDIVYEILRSHLEMKLHNPDSSLVQSERDVQEKVSALLVSDGKLAYWSKIDNLIFMQEAL
mmetsp:Transcript_2944/g.6828  ORF Transcript_2944/g.6828 Transcript_2944/m.6828 type:complete len:934 (+) Transcript_2944:377-3178(+)|eukprot:CAMPEP_0171589226 /NCGR_PEP_ID=MMETSP0961-20121227/14692_1 /TAXON_ID=87120 /ORGANISM="Aurantiochytrium limacinum, Strain ATCCMYA-1381" /LENGTH=933 /DNA_ID=CAMNT_0012148423 /DNA_START=350 /DNA_END=3151 /DNA_ORIENTATION=-